MLNFNRADRPNEPKEPAKPPLKPAFYEPPVSPAASPAGGGVATAARPAPTREQAGAAAVERIPPAPSVQVAPPVVPASAPAAPSASAMTAAAPEGSRLTVGVNIKLKGVEISDCDALVIEGLVEATVHSKAMTIEAPGSLAGTALIEVAEVHGEFTGELTARTRLVVRGSGRVRGTIRYGKLVVEEGGELSGDVRRIDDETPVTRSANVARPASA